MQPSALLSDKLLALLLGYSMGLSFWLSSNDPLDELVSGLSFTICCLLLMLLLRKSNTQRTLSPRTPPQHPIRGKVLFNTLLVGLLTGLSISSSLILLDKQQSLLFGLLFLLLGGLSGGILSSLLIGRPITIQPADRLIWTWQSFSRSLFSKRHVISTLLITGIGLLLFSMILWLIGTPVLGLLGGAIFGLCYWLLLGFFRGVESRTIDDQLRVVPNQGIHHSALNALKYGLIVTMLVGLGGILLLPAGTSGFIISLSIGLIVGLLFGLFNGGLACIRHSILRILLWRSGTIPWNYPHFLDKVAERVLLVKVGGGYIFLHRLLLEYLATQGIQKEVPRDYPPIL